MKKRNKIYLQTSLFCFLVFFSVNLKAEDTLLKDDVHDSPVCLAPPQDFVGVIKERHMLSKTEYRLKTRWKASHSKNVICYRIYKHGLVVHEVSAQTPLLFSAHLGSKKEAGDYEIAAVNSAGEESTHTSLRVISGGRSMGYNRSHNRREDRAFATRRIW